MAEPQTDPVVVDGGDRACGELLLVLAGRARVLAVGTRLRLIATDPAAAIDLPAWCYLTGHRFAGRGTSPCGRPHYDIQTTDRARQTDPLRPWRLENLPGAHPSSAPLQPRSTGP